MARQIACPPCAETYALMGPSQEAERLMPMLRLIGRVLPPGFKVTVGVDQFWWMDAAGKVASPKYAIKIADSNVVIECEFKGELTPELFIRIYIEAFDAVRGAVDLIAFATGSPLHVILEAVERPDGVTELIQLADPSLGQLCTAFRVNTTDE